jgi:hypothetical protein
MTGICGRVIGIASLVFALVAIVGVGAAGADPNGAKSALLPDPDDAAVDAFLVRAYREHWDATDA